MKQTLIGFFIMTGLGFSAFGSALYGDHSFPFKKFPLGDHSFPLVQPGYVTFVEDGDSIIVEFEDPQGGFRFVDLEGIDAMEVSYKGHHQGWGADLARDNLTKFLPYGTPVYVAFEEKTQGDFLNENYQMRGFVFSWQSKNKKWTAVNEWLLKEGLAVAHIVSPNVKKAEKFLALTRESQKAGRGIFTATLWKGVPYDFRVFIDEKAMLWVGDFYTKKLYPPEDYYFVPVSHRVYYEKPEAALDDGYSYRK